jgi:glycosyltransferase involved in cell wall biosynthesis
MPGRRLLFVYRFCGLGGVETSLLTKASALRRLGVDAQVLFSEFYGLGGEEIAKLPWVTIGLSEQEAGDLVRRGFDAIVVIDYPEFIGIIHRARVRTRVFFETHSSLPGSLPLFYSALHSSRIAAIVVPSRFNQRLIEQAGITSKPIEVIPNSVDLEAFRPLPREAVSDGFADLLDGPVILWVGRLEDEKNPVEFVEIAVTLLSARHGTHYLIVGDTPEYAKYRERLQQLIPTTVRDRFRFLRGVPNDRMPELYSLAAATGGCLVSTSLHEAQPMIFLEAMACACPIVATRVDGNLDLIIDRVCGRLYTPGDIGGAVATIGEVIDPRNRTDRNGLVQAAREKVVAENAPVRIATRYLELVERTPLPAAESERTPLVSGIVIFLNGENFLEEAIASVLAQTYQHWELLLVDDGSTDRSTAIAREYAARYPERIRYLEHAGHQNRGKSASRNFGLQHAKGEYIALLDHDDIWLPNKLQDQVTILEDRPEAAMMYGRTRYWHSWTGTAADEERDGFTVLGVEPDTLVMPPGLIILFLRDERTVASPCSVLIRREAAVRVGGFPESFHSTTYDDVAFLTQLYLDFPVFVANGCWDQYRQHRNNATATARRIGQWHPRRPNPRREMLLNWMEQYVLSKGRKDPDLLNTLSSALAPYRHPIERSPAERFYDGCLDATLALLRGEDAPAMLDRIGDASEVILDPQQVAEHILDAVPESTWNAPSLWLEIWPRLEPSVVQFLEQLEARARAPGLARRAHNVLRQLITSTWLLRVAEENQAALVLDGDDPDSARVAIAKLGTGTSWDIQLNRPRLGVTAQQRYRLTFRARADQPRAMAFGFAMARAPWSNLGLYRQIELTPEWQDIEEEFIAAADETNARVHFDIGGSAVPVEVSAVNVKCMSEAKTPDIETSWSEHR